MTTLKGNPWEGVEGIRWISGGLAAQATQTYEVVWGM